MVLGNFKYCFINKRGFKTEKDLCEYIRETQCQNVKAIYENAIVFYKNPECFHSSDKKLLNVVVLRGSISFEFGEFEDHMCTPVYPEVRKFTLENLKNFHLMEGDLIYFNYGGHSICPNDIRVAENIIQGF